MCVLCDQNSLELLVLPLDRLSHGDLANAIRTAREAAGVGVLDQVEAVLRGDAPQGIDPGLYGDVVIARARESGLISQGEAFAWESRIQEGAGLADPRVQAFLASGAEILDDYRVILAERRQIVARYLEVSPDKLQFGWIGNDWDLWFEYRSEGYAALTRLEAMEIVERELENTLHGVRPSDLIRYTDLPDSGVDLIAQIQSGNPETANELLSAMVDLESLAEDRVRTSGYGLFFKDEDDSPLEAASFGDWVIVHRPSH